MSHAGLSGYWQVPQWPENATLVEMFELCCRHYTGKAAVGVGLSQLSYSRLRNLTERFASYLQGAGYQPGERLAIMLPNQLLYPVVFFGALKAGLVVVPLDPEDSPQALAHCLKDSGCRGAVVSDLYSQSLREVVELSNIRHLIFSHPEDETDPVFDLVHQCKRWFNPLYPPNHPVLQTSLLTALIQGGWRSFRPLVHDPQAVAVLQYGHGYSRTRAAALTHQALLVNQTQMSEALRPHCIAGQELMLMPLPLHDAFTWMLLLWQMGQGGHTLLTSQHSDSGRLLETLETYAFTLMIGHADLFRQLLNDPAFERLRFMHLKLTLSVGMSLPQPIAEQWLRATGQPLMHCYGLREAGPFVAMGLVRLAKRRPLTYALKDTELTILDQGEVVAPGTLGELWVRGPQIMRGYWQADQHTQPDNKGWLHTGDIARLSLDGGLQVLDRAEDMIEIEGFSVWPSELEEVIASHPDIRECAAVAWPVEGKMQIKLYAVARRPGLSVKEVRDYCRERLTFYKVPAMVEFRDQLPKNRLGKTLRAALRPA